MAQYAYAMEPDEVLTREERITQLQDEIASLQGGGGSSLTSKSLMAMIENPGALGEKFGLNEQQAVNVKALVTGASSAAAVKYLSRAIGTEFAGALGGLLGGYISKKIFG